MIEYLPLATAIGGMISGFLVGLACNGDVKALNETINELEDGLEYWQAECDKIAEVGYRTACELVEANAEIDRLSDLVAKFQANKPLRTSDGKFASKRAAKTAELREYVASQAAS